MPLETADRPAAAPQLPLGYASVLPPARPERRIWAAVAALAVGVVLLGLALYGLFYVLRSVNVPRQLMPEGAERDVAIGAIILFAAICTILALVFLGVGLKWLSDVGRVRG